MDIDTLIDPRTGVIPALRPIDPPASLPRSFRMVGSVLSDTTRFGPWPADSSGAGYAFHDDGAARGAAIGEAVERYCGNLVPPGLRRATYDELVASDMDGVDALDPRTVALFSARQYSTTGFPFVPMDTGRELEWAVGTDLADGRPVLVPASLVWVSYVAASPARGVAFTNPIIQAGLAAGSDLEHARRSAIFELIERDAMTTAWHGGAPLRWIRPPDTIAALAGGRGSTLDVRFLELPNDLGAVVAGALVRDAATGYLTLGTAARSTAEPALRKALAEALQLQMFVADYDDPDGPWMRAARLPGSPLAPWRADRRYLDSYRPDLRDVVDYGCHLQLYLDPRMQERFFDELDRAVTGTVSVAELDAGRRGSVSRVADRVVVVDVTTEDVRPTGLRVVRVVAPGLYSNSAVGLRFLGGDRLPAQCAVAPAGPREIPLPH